jgi:Cu(I)/Ag(I) efflux system membrane protein CusA/SilA
VFALQAQEGRLFKPLAYTKTYSMAAAALLSVTLAPVLMGYLIRGRIRPEEENPINRFFIRIYHPAIDFVIRWRWAVIAIAALVVVWVFFPWNGWWVSAQPSPHLSRWQIVSIKTWAEFMPPFTRRSAPCRRFRESPTSAEILQQTIRSWKFRKCIMSLEKSGGRNATDPAPMDMIRTSCQMKRTARSTSRREGQTIAHRTHVEEL